MDKFYSSTSSKYEFNLIWYNDFSTEYGYQESKVKRFCTKEGVSGISKKTKQKR